MTLKFCTSPSVYGLQTVTHPPLFLRQTDRRVIPTQKVSTDFETKIDKDKQFWFCLGQAGDVVLYNTHRRTVRDVQRSRRWSKVVCSAGRVRLQACLQGLEGYGMPGPGESMAILCHTPMIMLWVFSILRQAEITENVNSFESVATLWVAILLS